MLKIQDLHVSYGAVRAIKGISLEVNDGELVSLIGANGAGKTTTLHTISGLVPAESGSIMLDGTDLRKTAPNRIIELGLAHVPEGRHVFARMTVEENLMMGAYIVRDKAKIKKAAGHGLRPLPAPFRARRASWRAPCPAASSRCWPWAAR